MVFEVQDDYNGPVDRSHDRVRRADPALHSNPSWLERFIGFFCNDFAKIFYQWSIVYSKAGAIVLLATGLSSCGLPSTRPSVTTETVKLDLDVAIDGQTYNGMFVVPPNQKESYLIKPAPSKNKSNAEYYFNTCHRDIRFFDSLEYSPNPVESSGYCPIVLTYASDRSGGVAEVQGAFFDFGSKHVDDPGLLPVLFCNGVRSLVFNGVAVCQAKVGTVQDLVFGSPRNFASPGPGCGGVTMLNESLARITIGKGYCVYTFKEKSGNKITRLTTYGYETWRQ